MIIRTNPYPFQAEAVAAMRDFGWRGLISMEPGLGKSLVALLCAAELRLRNVVVVCPANIKYGWADQCLTHAGIDAQVLESRKCGEPREGVKVVNYDILGDRLEELRSGVELVVFDECQALCSRTTKRTKAARELIRGVGRVLAMSGTPLVNKPAELWPVLSMLRPDVWGNFFQFANTFCNPRRTHYGMDYSGHKNLPKLNELLLEKVMFRRRRADVLKDLPAKIRNVVPLELSNQSEYRRAETDFRRWIASVEPEALLGALRNESLVRVGKLKRLAARLKLGAVAEWVGSFLESGRKLILFCYHTDVVEELAGRFSGRCVRITGDVSSADRERLKNVFLRDQDVRLMVANHAMAAGWSAPGVSDVAFCELFWQPGMHAQMADRVVGIGRGVVGEPSCEHWLVAKDTIEVKVCRILQSKQRVLSAVLDGEEMMEGEGVYEQFVEEMRRGK